MTTYVLAGGCFWCLDGVYRKVKGVESSACGYAGGSENDAHYSAVSSGNTEHAEAVEVTFDESVVPTDIILDIFFTIHDPTSLNRQGADVGPQYRSAMFYADDEQKQQFDEAVTRAQKNWDKPIVTQVVPLDAFYEAEAEHQDYYAQNPFSGYCSFVISPKVNKTKKNFTEYFI
ncbi:MAG: peptide-methionine (S)-S-oxide reductase MsrA [Candidatus Saccharimonadales bacterium]